MREASKRVLALKKMRMEMTRRFILLYKHFRHKKFGEVLPEEPKYSDEVDDLFDDDKEFILKIKAL